MGEVTTRRQGRIMKATGGFYYVDCDGQELECRARGLFRKNKQTPYVGDFVTVEETEGGKGYVVEIGPRKNFMVRPPVANIDQLVLVLSITDPPPNLFVVDKLLAIAQHKKIHPAIVITKCDLADPGEVRRTYEGAGYPVACVNSLSGMVDAVRPMLEGKVSVLSGNTGVGKSSLLNALAPELLLATGEISQKLGRGRHTTRMTQLYPLCGGLVADTPGFSSVDTEQLGIILKEELEDCFPEFSPYLGRCRFTGCSHTKEKGCAVLDAVRRGEISRSRHESYLAMYEEAKNIKEWEL